MAALDKISIALTLWLARFSPILSKVVVDGAYLRAAVGSFSAVPAVAAIALAVSSINASGAHILTPAWPVLLAIVIIGVFDALAGFLGTAFYVIGSLTAHLIGGHAIGGGDIRLLLGVIVAGFGPALLANSFRQFRRVPQNDAAYGWERIVDLFVIPFFGGWTAASMIGTLPALAGLTLPVANHVGDFSLAVAASLAIRVILEELITRWVPNRLDRLHPDTCSFYICWAQVCRSADENRHFHLCDRCLDGKPLADLDWKLDLCFSDGAWLVQRPDAEHSANLAHLAHRSARSCSGASGCSGDFKRRRGLVRWQARRRSLVFCHSAGATVGAECAWVFGSRWQARRGQTHETTSVALGLSHRWNLHAGCHHETRRRYLDPICSKWSRPVRRSPRSRQERLRPIRQSGFDLSLAPCSRC